MDYNSVTKYRFQELRPGGDGRLTTEWQLTDTKLLDAVKLGLPPMHAIPIIFVPGIMGSNLSDMDNKPVWLLNASIMDAPAVLAWNWMPKSAGKRQKILHPSRTKVYREGAVPKDNSVSELRSADLIHRGWGEVSESSYGKFLIWLHVKMNTHRDPLAWKDFSQAGTEERLDSNNRWREILHPGVDMMMKGLPDSAESGQRVEKIKSDDLISRSKSTYPIYAFGYNWLGANEDSAILLKNRISSIISENNRGPIKCSQVMLITHSMGGLVARACSQLPGMSKKIVGVVHGVMPSTGAAVAYRRCKVGMWDEDPIAGMVIGSNGKEVTAVFSQSPGALQLLPSEEYGANWLKIMDESGKTISSLPKIDPYDEIYLQRNRWWSLVTEDWLSPIGGTSIKWEEFQRNILCAKEFHRELAGKFHHNTFVFYGGGSEIKSFEKVIWRLFKGQVPEGGEKIPSADEVRNLTFKDIRTDGSNNLYVGGRSLLCTTTRSDASNAYARETSFWEIRCLKWNSVGDGTVPKVSGRAPRVAGGGSIHQQFELPNIKHEAAFRDYDVAKTITYYAVTKLAALADRA